jgi:hypothetical protein
MVGQGGGVVHGMVGSVDEGGGAIGRGGVDHGVLDERFVWALDSLVLHVGMVLLVLVHKVVHNLGPAVGQLDAVLACRERGI